MKCGNEAQWRNRGLIVAACAAAGMAVPLAAHAQSEVTIYGLVDLTVGVSQTGSGVTLPNGAVPGPSSVRVKRMDSGNALGSRLGFRGREDLGDGLRAIFLLEMGIAADTGAFNQGGLGWGRQVYVGLGGQNWQVTAGRQYSPMNAALGNSEALLGGYWGNITGQAIGQYESLGSTPGNGSYQSNTRVDNSVLITATGGPVTGNVMVAAGNESTRGTGRSAQGSVVYAAGPVRATAAYAMVRQNTEQIVAAADPEWLRQWMVGATYDFGPVKAYGGYFQMKGVQNRANLSPVATLGAPGASAFAYGWDKNSIYWLGVRIPFGVSTVVLQAANETYSFTNAAAGKSITLSAVYEYYLSKRTTLYGTYGQVSNNSGANTPLFAAIPAIGPNGYGADPKALSAGIRHSF